MNVNDRPGPAMALPSWARVGGTKAGALGWSLRRTPLPPAATTLSPCPSTADLPRVLPWVLWVGGRGALLLRQHRPAVRDSWVSTVRIGIVKGDTG